MVSSKKRLELIKRIVCVVLIAIFLPLLILNLTLIIKGLVNPDSPPDIFGYMPLAVLSGSMDAGDNGKIEPNGEFGEILVGDMIFVKKADPQTFKVGDVITFKDGGNEITTHRIVEVIKDGDKIVSFKTKGDANNVTDGIIPVERVFGIYQSRIGGLGNFVIFLQTPWGMLIFAGIPIAIFVCLEVVSFMDGKKKSTATAVLSEKDAEIERLKAMLEQNNNNSAETESSNWQDPQQEEQEN